MTHTPEPWRIGNWSNIYAGDNPNPIAGFFDGKGNASPRAAADSARVVACVNGCAGLNPAGYRQIVTVVEAIIRNRVLMGGETGMIPVGWLLFENLQQALALAEGKPRR